MGTCGGERRMKDEIWKILESNTTNIKKLNDLIWLIGVEEE
jgi:hypothetical protein